MAQLSYRVISLAENASATDLNRLMGDFSKLLEDKKDILGGNLPQMVVMSEAIYQRDDIVFDYFVSPRLPSLSIDLIKQLAMRIKNIQTGLPLDDVSNELFRSMLVRDPVEEEIQVQEPQEGEEGDQPEEGMEIVEPKQDNEPKGKKEKGGKAKKDKKGKKK